MICPALYFTVGKSFKSLLVKSFYVDIAGVYL
jgi:hypothetical protein